MAHDPTQLPASLPQPHDDGAALHLRWAALPAIELPATSGRRVLLSELDHAVLYFYPRTGIPGQAPNLGFAGEDWDSIPGARGCTPQSCGYRDRAQVFTRLGVQVLGVSTNGTPHQREFAARMQVACELLSDADLQLTRAMNLPTFRFPVESGGPETLLKRMAWFVTRPHNAAPARIVKVWYPVFPPDENAAAVSAWLTRRNEIVVIPIDHGNASHQAYIDQSLLHHWHAKEIYSRRVRFDAHALPGYLATYNGSFVGHITCAHDAARGELEVITLASSPESRGVGSRLLERAAMQGAALGCTRVFLTTTNDNLRAIEFYQRQGMRLVAVHRGAVEAAWDAKPDLPRVASNGLPIRDEWEFEIELGPQNSRFA